MVAYGTILKRARRPGWEAAYVDYEGLRALLERLHMESLQNTNRISDSGGHASPSALTIPTTELPLEDVAKQLQSEFLALLRKEIEKVSLFALSRQGEIAEAVGSLRFLDQDEELSIIPRTVPSFPSSSRNVMMFRRSSLEEEERIADHLGEEAALLPSGSIVTGPLKTPNVSLRKVPQMTTARRPLFKARQSLADTYMYTESHGDQRADQYAEQGVELLHILRYITINAMGIRKIIKKHDKIIIQLQHNAGSHIFTTKKQAASLLVNGPENHLQLLANSESVAAIHASLLAALQELKPTPLEFRSNTIHPSWIRLQCTASSVQVLREYAQRMEETFKGFLSQRAMINIGSNSGGLSYATQQALQLVVRFQPDSLLFMNEPALQDWYAKVMMSGAMMGDDGYDLATNLTHMPEEKRSWGGVESVSMWINLMSALLYTVNYYIVAPTANNYARLLGVDGAFGATLVGASSLAAIFAAFLYSFWYAKGSFRSALLCSAACPCLGNILYALAISYNSMPMALTGRLLVGLGSAEVVNRQLISACVAYRYMTAASAIFVAASAIGMSIGPLLAAILDASSGRDTTVDIKLPFLPAGGIIYDHVTSPGFVMASLWFLELMALLFFFKEPERVNTGEKEKLLMRESATSSSTSSQRRKSTPKRTTSGHFRQISVDFVDFGTAALPEARFESPDSYQNGSPGQMVHAGFCDELVTVKNLIFGNIALPITMLLFGFIELVDEVLITSCSMVCRRYFGWHGSRAGLLLSSLGALVLPAHYFVESASHRYEERAIVKHSLVFIIVSLFAILNYEGLFFDTIGFAVQAVDPGAGGRASNSTTARDILDISVGGQSITKYLNKQHEVPYDWGAGVYVYITLLSAVFMGTIILEGVDTSIMAQKTPPALNDTFINSGLLATLVGTLGRVVGDSIITFSALVAGNIFADFVNATFFPLIPLALIGLFLVCRYYHLFASASDPSD